MTALPFADASAPVLRAAADGPLAPDPYAFADPWGFAWAVLVVFGLFLGQFLLLAGGAWTWFWGLRREHFAPRFVQQRPVRRPRPLVELAWSVLSIAVFAVLIVLVLALGELGVARIYWTVDAYGWGWLVASVGVLALVHDSYYYWAHRWMHHPRVFRHVHKLHHRFHNPTPFASYAFHPLEAVVEVAWFLPVALLLPLHPLAMAAYVVVLTALNVVSHLGVETYPPWVARWFVTSTHHNLHHARGRGHFMLYFNVWDRWMGTNAEDYEARIRAIDARARAARRGSGAERGPRVAGVGSGTTPAA